MNQPPKEIPFTFEHRGKTITGILSRVSGGGTSAMYHIYIDKLYSGQLWKNQDGKWMFASQKGYFPEWAEYFGGLVDAHF